MTPKEKADDLVTKMLKEVGYDTDLAIPCALIAVDEIFFALKYNLDGATSGSVKYWTEVKQEIKQEIENL